MKTSRTNLADFLDHIIGLGYSPLTVFDIGVALGTFPLYEKFSDASHLLIEPLYEFEEKLIEISRKYKADYVLAAARAIRVELLG